MPQAYVVVVIINIAEILTCYSKQLVSLQYVLKYFFFLPLTSCLCVLTFAIAM
jgi:hypothetical protein